MKPLQPFVVCVAVVCSLTPGLLAAGSRGTGVAAAEDKPQARSYTNDDLERISALRDQTGVLSKPAAAPAPARSRDSGEQSNLLRQEQHWRREVEQLRTRVAPLRARAAEMERKIEARRRKAGLRPQSDPGIADDERRLQELQARIREMESRFEERARRAGAFPGWLR